MRPYFKFALPPLDLHPKETEVWEQLAATGDLRLACQVVELAVKADPESTTAHGARAEIYQQRRNEEFSLMSKGIFAATARESRAIADQ